MSRSSAQTTREPSAALAEFLATLSSSVELGGRHSVSVPGAGGGSERRGGARWRSPWQCCGEGEEDKRGAGGLLYSVPPLRFKVSGCGGAAGVCSGAVTWPQKWCKTSGWRDGMCCRYGVRLIKARGAAPADCTNHKSPRLLFLCVVVRKGGKPVTLCSRCMLEIIKYKNWGCDGISRYHVFVVVAASSFTILQTNSISLKQ